MLSPPKPGTGGGNRAPIPAFCGNPEPAGMLGKGLAPGTAGLGEIWAGGGTAGVPGNGMGGLAAGNWGNDVDGRDPEKGGSPRKVSVG